MLDWNNLDTMTRGTFDTTERLDIGDLGTPSTEYVSDMRSKLVGDGMRVYMKVLGMDRSPYTSARGTLGYDYDDRSGRASECVFFASSGVHEEYNQPIGLIRLASVHRSDGVVVESLCKGGVNNGSFKE